MTAQEKQIRERLEEPRPAPADRDAELEQLRHDNADLRVIIDELLRRLYGKKSEKLAPVVPATDPNGAPIVAAPKEPRPAKPGHGRTPFAPHLPREVVEFDVPPDERRCTICRAPMRPIGEDTCERGHLEPIRIIIKRWVSKKYACPMGHMVKCAPGAPPGLVERAKWTTATYAHVVVSKFGDHLPLDRIAAGLKRQGIDLPKSTQCEMAELVGDKIAPILEQAKKELLAHDHLQADETPLAVMIEGRNGVQSGFLWGYRAKEIVLFEFDLSRAHHVPQRFLGDWKGTMQTDGYSGYDAVVRANGIRHAGCWAHARRKWKEAFDLGAKDAEKMLWLMRRLWRLEAGVKARMAAKSLTSAEGQALLTDVRNRRSRVMVTKVRGVLDAQLAKQDLLPKSPLGKAVTYLHNQWSPLQLFLDDAEIEIDNNAIERAIRPIAIGRRNWHVAGSAKGAATAARLFSIVNMCKALDIDPYLYLTDVLEKVSPHADLAALTPWAWAKARDQPPPTA